MKIKDTRIAEKLQGIIAQGYCTKENEQKEMDSTLMIDCENAILNTDLDPNDICEVDVEKLATELANFDQQKMGGLPIVNVLDILGYELKKEYLIKARAIAKAGVIKFKEK